MRNRPHSRYRARGFALMLALFLIVTLSAIGVYLVTISTGQVEAAAQDEQGVRAYQSARAGVDWAAFQLLCNPSNSQCNRPASAFFTSCTGGGGAASQTLTLAQGLAGFYAEVTCQRVGNETEAGATLAVYRLTVTGCNQTPCSAGTGPTYVERQLQLTLTQ